MGVFGCPIDLLLGEWRSVWVLLAGGLIGRRERFREGRSYVLLLKQWISEVLVIHRVQRQAWNVVSLNEVYMRG